MSSDSNFSAKEETSQSLLATNEVVFLLLLVNPRHDRELCLPMTCRTPAHWSMSTEGRGPVEGAERLGTCSIAAWREKESIAQGKGLLWGATLRHQE